MITRNIILFSILFISKGVFGQNYQEIQKLQDEYKKVLDRQALQKPPSISEAEKSVLNTAVPDKLIYSRKDVQSLIVTTEKLLEELKIIKDSTSKMPYIGYDFFTKRDTIPFWQNLPISSEYKLGPGDEIIISLWGESNSFHSEIINRDGQVFLDNVGILNLGGKSILNAKNYIISKYSRVYSTLVGQNPKSFIDLTLGELKSINVHFVGFVNIPGVHMLHPFSNVITGLIQAGGVDYKGSLRKINVVRNNKIIGSIDIYKYLIEDGSFEDIRLMDQDVIYVPPRISTIPITGRIYRPGYFELTKDENLGDIIKLSGGRERGSSEKIFVFKNEKNGKDGHIVDFSEINKFKISQGDSIHVPLITSSYNFVKISGQVKNQGLYPYSKNLSLKELLIATSSFKYNDFQKTMDLSNILIFRRNSEGQDPLKIIADIKNNIKLERGDHITIPPKKLLEPIKSIVISGEIEKPGIYPANNMTTLGDILKLSGGYTESALIEGIEIFRDSLKIAWNDAAFILFEGDSLNVMRKSGLVAIKGEINVPGFITYKKNDSLDDYIRKAGGFTSFANQRNIYVVYPNGISSSKSFFKSPKIKEGSTIYVSPRNMTDKQEITGWQAFSALTSQAGSIATTLLSLSLIINQNNAN